MHPGQRGGLSGQLSLPKDLIDVYIMPLLAMDNPVFTGLLHALLTMACLYVVGALCALAYMEQQVRSLGDS